MAAAPVNSRKSFYNKILNLLNDGGDDGLHVDDLVYLVGCEKKDLIPRLKELNGRGEIKEVEKGRWKKKSSAGAANGDGDDGLIKIHLPGDPKFSSYKNSLQEYCQKKSLPVPKYNSTHEGTYLIGSVTFGNSVVKCDEPCANVKEADALAAFDALKQLGYFAKDIAFTNTTELNQLKRKATVSNLDTTIQILGKDGVTHKSKLNEYVHKKHLTAPTYDTVAVNDGYFSTVLVDNKQFKGRNTCKKRKEAEQSAAQVALNALIGIPMSSEEGMVLGEDDVTKMISEARQASQPMPYKTRLQEHCVKHGETLPTYTTQVHPSDNQQYQCSVTVCGHQYFGQFTRGKKGAEARAAEEALNALKSMT